MKNQEKEGINHYLIEKSSIKGKYFREEIILDKWIETEEIIPDKGIQKEDIIPDKGIDQ